MKIWDSVYIYWTNIHSHCYIANVEWIWILFNRKTVLFIILCSIPGCHTTTTHLTMFPRRYNHGNVSYSHIHLHIKFLKCKTNNNNQQQGPLCSTWNRSFPILLFQICTKAPRYTRAHLNQGTPVSCHETGIVVCVFVNKKNKNYS